MSKSFGFYYQKRFGGNNIIGTSAIKIGSTRGKGSSTRMFNYCKQHSKDTSECINQFINIVPSPPTPVPPPTPNIYNALGKGLNDVCYSLAFYQGNLYAGGPFTTAGDISANSIAKWNGSSWSTLGSGLVAFLGIKPMASSAIDKLGNLYAGGGFHTAGDVSANNIAKWNGSSWSALGDGIGVMEYDSCNSLAFDTLGNLYAGGLFTTAGGISANNIVEIKNV